MVNWVYMMEPQLEHLVTRYRLNCTTSDIALIKNVHWKRRYIIRTYYNRKSITNQIHFVCCSSTESCSTTTTYSTTNCRYW